MEPMLDIMRDIELALYMIFLVLSVHLGVNILK